jgi:nicotinamide-nucleotide amidase
MGLGVRAPFPATVLSIGTELTSGRTMDTHASILSRAIAGLGGRVEEVRVVPDDLPAIVRALKALASRVRLLVVTGGLGPTEDDRTRQALAGASRRPLHLHAPSLRCIEARFRSLARPMSPNNRLQAFLPSGAMPLPNVRGTAPGIWMRLGGCRVVVLPGVSSEMSGMWESQALPRLRREFQATPVRTRLLHCVGIPESEVDQRIGELMRAGRNPEVGLNVGGGRVTVAIRAWGPGARRLIARDEALVRARLGEAVFGTDGDTLAGAVVKALRKRRETLALAESATGGRIARMVTEVPGASRVLLEGRVVYTEAAKRRLGVPASLLKQHGPVSAEVTAELARRIRRATGATWGLAVTGVAGPSGGTGRTPVGTTFVAWAGPRDSREERRCFPGPRAAVQQRMSVFCLDALRIALARR